MLKVPQNKLYESRCIWSGYSSVRHHHVVRSHKASCFHTFYCCEPYFIFKCLLSFLVIAYVMCDRSTSVTAVHQVTKSKSSSLQSRVKTCK